MSTVLAARIIRVVTGNTTATLVHAIDDDGRDQKLELEPAAARTIVPGQVLILQWSVHNIPELTGAPTLPITHPADPLDHEFDSRLDTPAPVTGARTILDEFNALLGMPRRKG